MTLIDYPGKISATVFLIGCNFRCPFCHNPELVMPELIKNNIAITEKDFFEFLNDRKGLVEGICVTGGEPTLQKDLPDFFKKIKESGFFVKLDTNGINPEMLSEIVNKQLVDYIAMDIKTSKDFYEKAAGTRVNLKDIDKSIEIIRQSETEYEFRTTVVPTIVNKEDIKKISEWLKGCGKFVLQQFRTSKLLDESLQFIKPYPEETFYEFQKILKTNIKNVELRL